MIIVFEGLNRCGKSTQITKLAERLEYEKNKVFVFQEPGTSDVGKIIRNDIIKNSTLKPNPVTQTFLFSACRSELSSILFQKFSFEEMYGPDVFILIDRWKASMYAHQGAKLWSKKPYITSSLLTFINKCNEIASFDIHPNLSLFFELDLETIKLRLQSEQENDIFSNEKDIFLKRVVELYNRYILENDKMENFIKINSNNKSIDFIHEEVYNITMHFRKELQEINHEPKKEE